MVEPNQLDPSAAHRSHFTDNRANWDDRAALHEASGYGIAELLASPSAVTKDVTDDLERLGDLDGLDVIHLQCHLGLDTISLARLGARRVVGLDMSPRSLDRARELARRAEAHIELIESNVYAAREVVTGDFDLVYTTLGVLCWLPDIDAWARVAACLLRPGGRLVLEEVSETRVSSWCRWPGLMESCEGGYRFTDPAVRDMLPLQVAVVARRPAEP